MSNANLKFENAAKTESIYSFVFGMIYRHSSM